jgi:hypothetical protein
MADLTLAQMLGVRTADEIRDRIFGRLNKDDFPITDFESGGVVRTITEAAAAGIAEDVTSLIPKIAGGGIPSLAVTDWLTLLAHEVYGTDRIGASSTVQLVKLKAALGVGPYTVSAGDLVVQAATGNRYILAQSGTIPIGTALGFGGVAGVDYVSLQFKAESPGGKYADAAGSITKLVTPLPGVSASNEAPVFSVIGHSGAGTGTVTLSGTPSGPARFTLRISVQGQADAAEFDYSLDGGSYVPGGIAFSTGVILPGGTVVTFTDGTNPSFLEGDTYTFSAPGSPIVVQGADEESNASLAKRLSARWPALAEITTSDLYEQWAFAASAEVTKVTVQPKNTEATPGRVQIVIAGAVNPLTSAVAVVQAYVDDRHPITDQPVVLAADVVDVSAIGEAHVYAKDLLRIQETAQLQWQEYLNEVAIGGTFRSAKLAQILMDAGAIDFRDLTVGPSGDASYEDYTLADTEVARANPIITLDLDLTWIVH